MRSTKIGSSWHLYLQLKLLRGLERLGVLAADPHGILLVDAGGPGRGPLRQGADGNQTAHDRPGLFALADALRQSLAAVGHCLDRVVTKAGKHTVLERADTRL